MNRLLRGLVCGLALSASAQGAWPRADAEYLHLDPAGRGSLFVGNGQTLKQGKFRVGAAFQYGYGAFKFSSPSGIPTVVVRDKFGVDIFGAVGITDWLELSAFVPVIAGQLPTQAATPVTSAGLGTPVLGLKFGLLDEKAPVQLAIGLGVGFPVGSGTALGNQGFQFIPRVNLGRAFTKWQLGLELGANLRTEVANFNTVGGQYWDRTQHQLWLGASVSTVGKGARGEVTGRLYIPMGVGWTGGEALLGFRVPFGDTELFAAAGPGFGGFPSQPTVRLYVGAAFGNAGPPLPRCEENDDYELADCPDLDKDHDGVANGVDKEPLKPEDKDGFQDEDGAPDPDNDGDGVLDGDDSCKNVKGLVENKGCPDVDTDGDGLVDRLDKCPAQAEDKDGFEDADGCPDLDNDADGVPDADDACKNEKGPAENRGCPVVDTDGDGVADSYDNCPTEKGVPENSGCPAAQKQLVVITREKIKILDKVQFATGSAKILAKSFPLLDQIAGVLTGQARIKLVQVEGHTDNVGQPESNKKLSEDRAKSVVEYLVKKAIAAGRLKAVGFGQEKPLEPNDTAKGKEANRRVEFNILEQD
jgi:outer membrane protein OmpA-like peptidoglycan-associated protein